MPYRVAGIDVHKRMLAVVMADVTANGNYEFTRRRVGTSPRELRELAAWLVAEEVEEVVMESTAQYWRPVWETLERAWQPERRTRAGAGPVSGTLHLAQAQSNRGPRGRKRDFPDAERLVKRLVAQELTLIGSGNPRSRFAAAHSFRLRLGNSARGVPARSWSAIRALINAPTVAV